MAKRTLEDSIGEGNKLLGKNENNEKRKVQLLAPWQRQHQESFWVYSIPASGVEWARLTDTASAQFPRKWEV